MNRNDERDLLREALARPADCPQLERLIDAAFAATPTAAERALLEHASACAACAAELDLARSFDGEARSAEESGEIAWVAGRIDVAAGRKASDAAAPLARVLPMRRTSKRREAATNSAPWSRWAAAALVLVGLGVALRWNATSRPPSLPDGPISDVVRGAELVLDTPVGDVESEPREFRWRAVTGAEGYRIEVRDVAGDLLYAAESGATAFATPPELAGTLESRVSYSWVVVARGAGGVELTRSTPAIFRFERD
jgi:hypothetical protein